MKISLEPFLGACYFLFFTFAPFYFIVHLIFNYLGITNSFLFILLAFFFAVITFFTIFPEDYKSLKTSPLSTFALLGGTGLLSIICLKVGIDDSTDTYFYHLNTTIPIVLHHDLLNTHLYDLIGYSIGYPKFGELLQAIFIQLTNNFWGYGLATVLVIPASYTITYLLARKIGLEPHIADCVGLAYAFNPINVVQATTGYIDSVQSLYLLTTILLAINATNLPRFIFFLINLVVLLNIKFTGLLLGSATLLLWIIWHCKWIWQDNQRFYYFLWALALSFVGLAHYLTNWVKFDTMIYPFIDAKLAQYLSSVYIGIGGKLERIFTLFWSIPQPFASISTCDTVRGSFGILWYPMPFFILLAVIKAFHKRHYAFLAIQTTLWILLFSDPAQWGRYVTYFQFAGIVATFYLFSSFPRSSSVITLFTLAYLLLGVYIIFNSEQGIIKRRLAQYNKHHLFIESVDSTARRAFHYYYDINSACSGYYWLLKFKQVEVNLIQQQPSDDNYFYIYRKPQGDCTFSVKHSLDYEKKVYDNKGTQFSEVKINNPFALEYCKFCISEYGCMYMSFYVHEYTRSLSEWFQNYSLEIECQSIDGKKIEDSLTLR